MLATKFDNPMSRDPNHRGASRRRIVRACEDSLRRLGTDHIDLYQVHRLAQLESQLSAADVRLGADVLDAIDAVIAPGETLDRGDYAFEPRALRHFDQRRH